MFCATNLCAPPRQRARAYRGLGPGTEGLETRPREGTAVGCEGTARRTQECWRRKPGQSPRPGALPRDAERAGHHGNVSSRAPSPPPQAPGWAPPELAHPPPPSPLPPHSAQKGRPTHPNHRPVGCLILTATPHSSTKAASTSQSLPPLLSAQLAHAWEPLKRILVGESNAEVGMKP